MCRAGRPPHRPDSGALVHRCGSAESRLGFVTATLSPWITEQPSSSWARPVGSGRAPSPSRSADAWRPPGRPRWSWTWTSTAGDSRSPQGWNTSPAAAGTSFGMSAVACLPSCSSRPSGRRWMPRALRARRGITAPARARCARRAPRAGASGARVVVDVPRASASMPALLSHGPLVVVLVSLTTRGLADADAVVQRLHDAVDDTEVDETRDARPQRPDLRLVTRGGRPGAAVVDEVVTHLGIPHILHVPMTGLSRGMPSAASSPGRTGTRCAAVPTPSRPSSTASRRLMSLRAEPFRGDVVRSIRAGAPPSPAAIEHLAAEHADTLGADGRTAAVTALLDQLVGMGPLARLARDASVTDLLVNGDGTVWVDRGAGVEAAGLHVPRGDLRPLAVRLAGLTGRRLDDAQPWVDGLLPGGVRLHALLPPLADGGPHLSLRFARQRPGGVDTLVALGAASPGMAVVLRALVDARVSLVVSGGTGVGKTTVLSALLAECDPQERLVLVEDVRELDPRHPHVVRLQGRSPNVEGPGSRDPRRPRPAGAADASGPPRRRGGAGAGGPRAARRSQHRARGRHEHGARQRARGGSGEDRGTRRRSPACHAPPSTRSCEGRSRRSST